MRRKHHRRNSEEYLSELAEFNNKPMPLANKYAQIGKTEDKLKGIKSVAHDEKMLDESGRPNPIDELPDDKMKPKVEDGKVTNALSNLSTNTKDTKNMYSRVYSVPSDLKGNKRAQKTGQVPSSINIFGSHYPVVKIVNDNTLLLHTSNYGQEGKTTELVNKIKADLPNHFPDFKIVHIHHPDYRHSAKIMRMRNKKGLHNFLTEASTNHPDEEYRTHALDALEHINKIKKGEYTKPIHAKRTESEGWDGAANEQGRVDKIHSYLTSLGLSPDTSAGKKRDLGANGPTSININAKGDPHDQQLLHEGGHALATPAGMELGEYQSSIGQPGFKGKIHQSKFRTELKEAHDGGMPEEAAQHLEGLIARRSGVEPFRSPNRGASDKSSQERSRQYAKDQINLFDEGIVRFDPFSGEAELQGTINAYINSKMMGNKNQTEKIKAKLHQHLEAKKKYKASDEYEGEFEDEGKLAASEIIMTGLTKGSFQRRNKFNPSTQKEGDKTNIKRWQQDSDERRRDDIPRLEGGGRERALRKLASHTEVRIKDGKKHYLLHRGMNDLEHDNAIDRKSGKTNYHSLEEGSDRTNSWTPHYNIASGFSQDSMGTTETQALVDKDLNIHNREPVSAWFSEDDIHHYLPQSGDDKGKGENEYKTEGEVLINHTQGHHLASRDIVEQSARRQRGTNDNKDMATIPRMRQIEGMKPEVATIERNRRINSRVGLNANKRTALRNESQEIKNIKAGKKPTDRDYLEDRRLNQGVPNSKGDMHSKLNENPDLQSDAHRSKVKYPKLAASEVINSDMYKGELINAAKGLVLATTMASIANNIGKAPQDSRQPAAAPQAKERSVEGTNLDPNIKNRPAYLNAKEEAKAIERKHIEPFNVKRHTLSSISDVESSGGKNLKHARLPQHSIHQGESAFGKYGLTPLLIRETIKKHPDLNKKYGYLSNFKGRLFHEGMQGANRDGKLEDDIASRHYDRLAKQFGHSPEKIGYAWLNGVTGTHRAIKQGRNFNKHWHVKKIMNAYNKRNKK